MSQSQLTIQRPVGQYQPPKPLVVGKSSLAVFSPMDKPTCVPEGKVIRLPEPLVEKPRGVMGVVTSTLLFLSHTRRMIDSDDVDALRGLFVSKTSTCEIPPASFASKSQNVENASIFISPVKLHAWLVFHRCLRCLFSYVTVSVTAVPRLPPPVSPKNKSSHRRTTKSAPYEPLRPSPTSSLLELPEPAFNPGPTQSFSTTNGEPQVLMPGTLTITPSSTASDLEAALNTSFVIPPPVPTLTIAAPPSSSTAHQPHQPSNAPSSYSPTNITNATIAVPRPIKGLPRSRGRYDTPATSASYKRLPSVERPRISSQPHRLRRPPSPPSLVSDTVTATKTHDTAYVSAPVPSPVPVVDTVVVASPAPVFKLSTKSGVHDPRLKGFLKAWNVAAIRCDAAYRA
jgi:hypothetical protein